MSRKKRGEIHFSPQDMFLTTRWTAVLKAARSDTTCAQAALAELCETYWYPLYAYVRRRGREPHDAEDYGIAGGGSMEGGFFDFRVTSSPRWKT